MLIVQVCVLLLALPHSVSQPYLLHDPDDFAEHSFVKRRQPHCQPKARHYGSWSKWATKGNRTQGYLSLLSPNLPEVSLRNIHSGQLIDNPVLAGDHKCPSTDDRYTPGGNHNDPIMDRSMCPWYWRINYDPLRMPAVLPEAHCRCDRAVTGNRLFSCQPLTIRIKVGRFDESCDQFADDTIELSVACVSVIQSSLIIDPQQFSGVEKTLILNAQNEI